MIFAFSQLRMAWCLTICVAASVMVGGCGGKSLLETGGTPTTLMAAPAGAAAPKWSLVSLPRMTGVTPEFAQLLTREIDAKARLQAIALLVESNSPADVVLQGNLAITRDKQTAKIFYRWDVTDPSGKLLQRMENFELSVVPQAAKEPWIWVSPVAISNIADKAMEALSKHLRPSEIVSATETQTPTVP